MNHYEIFSDGACSPNPGAGGYAAIIFDTATRKTLKVLTGGYRLSTNNRQELLAVIIPFEWLSQPSRVTLFSDSRYVLEPLRLGWAESWKRKGWRKSDNEFAKNSDLWARFLDALKPHAVQYEWVRGHDGNNLQELVDAYAVEARMQKKLDVDSVYEEEHPFRASAMAPPIVKPKSAPAYGSVGPSQKVPITYDGQPCRDCDTPVKRVPTKSTTASGRKWIFTHLFYCPGCGKRYMDEASRVTL